MMSNNGLTKLVEECGELIQIAAKKIAYYDVDTHPDGNGSMRTRLEDEIADVMAACYFVQERFALDQNRILVRMDKKRATFVKWQKEP